MNTNIGTHKTTNSFGAIKLNVKAPTNTQEITQKVTPKVIECFNEILANAGVKLEKSSCDGNITVNNIEHLGKQGIVKNLGVLNIKKRYIFLTEDVFHLTGVLNKKGKVQPWEINFPVATEEFQTDKTVEEYSSGLASLIERPFKPFLKKLFKIK